ncbi:MAG TPA: transposase [Phycisphaerae bacterium]|nr:transposase [Phycisphaerae bacterium]
MGYWSKPEMDRDQMVLLSTTLSERIPEDHSVRLFWELLETYDWRPWEGQYCGCQGQPAIHPRIVAGVLLYGLTQGIRSSRRLEWACGHAVDLMWLAEGRTIDHSTLCAFRRRFGGEVKLSVSAPGSVGEGDGGGASEPCSDRRDADSGEQQPWREKMRAKVYSEQGRAVYRQRQYVAESPFGPIKTAMGIRQFLLRGWKRVQSEWRWICTAYDLRIRVRWVARQRQRLAAAGL